MLLADDSRGPNDGGLEIVEWFLPAVMAFFFRFLQFYEASTKHRLHNSLESSEQIQFHQTSLAGVFCPSSAANFF